MIAFHMVGRRVSCPYLGTSLSGLAPGITRALILITSSRS